MRIISTIIEETKKSLVTVVVNDSSKMVCLEYDKEHNVFKTTIFVPYNSKTVFVGEKKARAELSKLSSSSLDTTYKEIKSEIKQYEIAKERLKKLAEDNFSALEVDKILKFLDIVCMPYRYVGLDNRFIIDNNTHIRLTSTPDWNSSGEFHLQKCVRDDNEVFDTHYPKQSELEILKEVVSI